MDNLVKKSSSVKFSDQTEHHIPPIFLFFFLLPFLLSKNSFVKYSLFFLVNKIGQKILILLIFLNFRKNNDYNTGTRSPSPPGRRFGKLFCSLVVGSAKLVVRGATGGRHIIMSTESVLPKQRNRLLLFFYSPNLNSYTC